MFFRRPNINQSECAEIDKCEDTIAFLKVIADEKCRAYRVGDWMNDTECVQASKAVVEQAKQCLNLQRGKKGPTG